ncbi:unnamed protein product [Ostreobium quekettii]|uniref:Protein kinase domain-containing protein n=1 Tax=Ostreobium quekettii TaxID=121088 RepID=A0A8S1J2Q0_9CHLO|nr:unnamed protein product [Ostreobium quekettii]|eukprot:evm.model.scf_477.8 EVM.evm.TU.scf_477.8   scf_477:75558-80181(+)
MVPAERMAGGGVGKGAMPTREESLQAAAASPFHGVDPQVLSQMLSFSSLSRSPSDILHAFPALWDTPFIPKSQLIFVRQIGQGSFGRVFKGILYEQDVAIKELTVRNVVDALGESAPEPRLETGPGASGDADASTIAGNLLALEKEVSVLRTLRFQKVVMFLGVCLDPPCIVTEYCARGSLFDVLARAKERPEANGKRLTWKRRMGMALDAAKGMNYLHCHIPTVEHRDLKSPNLLVDEHWGVKVADFNTSKFIDPIVATASVCANNPRWLAPEVLESNLHTTASDVYPFGIIMWELLTWEQPWEQDNVNTFQILQFVLRDDLRPQIPPKEELPGDALPDDLYTDYLALMRECWDKDPCRRPSFQDIVVRLQHMMGALGHIARAESQTQDAAKSVPPMPSPMPVHKQHSPRTQVHSATPFASGPFAGGPPSPPEPEPCGIPKHLDTGNADIASRLRRSASTGQRCWQSLRELFATERKEEGHSENWTTLMHLLMDAPSLGAHPDGASEGESQDGVSLSLSDKDMPEVPGSVTMGSPLGKGEPKTLKKGSKWRVVQSVLGEDIKPKGWHKGWQVVKEVLQSEGSGITEEAIQEAIEQSQKRASRAKASGRPPRSPLKRKTSGKWGIVRDLMCTEDVYPAHPGWDFLRSVVKENAAGAGASPGDAVLASGAEGQSEAGAQEKLPEGDKTGKAPGKKTSKRWGELRGMLLGEMDERPKAQQPLHPGWQVLQEALGMDGDGGETQHPSPRPSFGDQSASDSPPPEPRTPTIEESATSSSGDVARSKHPVPPKAEDAPQVSTGWGILRQVLKTEEGSAIANRWEFLEDLLKDKLSSSGSSDADHPTSQGGMESAPATPAPPKRKLQKKGGVSKHWKKVKDLLIVDTDPPSPEKWHFLKEWLTGDDDLGPEWHELRDFAARIKGVPEGPNWNIFRTLFFEDTRIRSHPHWSFLKDLLVKDAHPSKKELRDAATAFKTNQVRRLFSDPRKPINESQWGALRTLMMNNANDTRDMEELREYAMENEAPPVKAGGVKSNWDDILQVLGSGRC